MRAFALRYWFWLVLALPVITMLLRVTVGSGQFMLHNMLEPTGETSARLLVLALCATPLSMALPGWRGPRWLVRNRRAIGVAAFLYGCLHLALYFYTSGSLGTVIDQIGWPYIWLGWLAFVLLIPLALTSTNRAVRRLGRNWKKLHRLVYLAAGLTFLHWVVIYGGSIVVNVLLNFSPFIVLSLYRFWLKRQQSVAKASV